MPERKTSNGVTKYQVALLMSLALGVIGFLGKSYATRLEQALQNVPSAEWRKSVDSHMTDAEGLRGRFLVVEERATETRDLVKLVMQSQERMERKLDTIMRTKAHGAQPALAPLPTAGGGE